MPSPRPEVAQRGARVCAQQSPLTPDSGFTSVVGTLLSMGPSREKSLAPSLGGEGFLVVTSGGSNP